MLLFGISFQIYEITGDPSLLAYIFAAMVGPTFVFGIVTGYVSDRFDRRTVLIAGYLALAVAGAGLMTLSYLGLIATALVFGSMTLVGTARAFINPATNAIIPNLVPLSVFPNAVAWNTVTSKTAQMVGPTLGGIIYTFGPEFVYGVATASFLLGTLGTALIRPRGAGAKGQKMTVNELLAGAVFVWHKKVVLGAILLDLMLMVMASCVYILPIIAIDILHVGPAGAGVIRSAMAVGGLLAAFTMTRFPITCHAGRIMFASTLLVAALSIGMGLSTSLVLSSIIMALIGATDMISVNIRQILIQIATPNDMRGRVGAVSTIAGNSGNELGAVRAGLVAAVFGIVPTIVMGGVIGMCVVGACWKLFPELTKIQRIDREV
jgi:MFS family permease